MSEKYDALDRVKDAIANVRKEIEKHNCQLADLSGRLNGLLDARDYIERERAFREASEKEKAQKS